MRYRQLPSGLIVTADLADGLITTGKLADDAVTYAKMQNVSATSRVLGRATAGAGIVEELTFSQVLDFVGSAAQGDILYRGASSWARLAAGASGQVLQTQGGGANPQWADAGGGSVTPEAEGSLSSVSSLDIDLSGGADMYEIDLMTVVPANDAVSLELLVSQSSSFLSGASDYAWCFDKTSFQNADASDNSIQLSSDIGSSSNEGATITLRVFRPAVSPFQKRMSWMGFVYDASSSIFETLIGGGAFIGNTNAIDGVRFLFSSGNIASGYYAIRSYSFT